jgi:hydrogenase expression/formation protein HypC
MKVVRIDGETGVVRAGGLKRSVNLSLMKALKAGDYVLVHAGFAIEKVKEDEAARTLKALKDIDEIRR